MALSSSRPYLIRALYDWIVDGGEDPYVVVDCFYPGVEVPESHIKDGQIVLNLAPQALNAWEMSDFGLMFETRFGGIPTALVLPYGAITADPCRRLCPPHWKNRSCRQKRRRHNLVL